MTRNLSTRKITTFFIIILTTGIFLRLYTYILFKELWYDEAALATNIVDPNILGILGSLLHNQSAPLGFLILNKALFLIFGNSFPAYIAHIIPLISGITLMPLTYILIKKVSKNEITPIYILLIISILPSYIYYSVEFKQYILETLATTLLVLSFIPFLSDGSIQTKDKRNLILASVFNLAFSQLSILLIAIFSAGASLFQWTKIEQPKIKFLLINTLYSGSIFIIIFLLSGFHSLQNTWFRQFWINAKGFLLLTDSGYSLSNLIQPTLTLFSLGTKGYIAPTLFLILFLIGIISKNHLHKLKSITITILVIVCLLSILKIIPLVARINFYLYPLILIYIALGTEYIWKQKYKIILVVFLILLLLSQRSFPAQYAWNQKTQILGISQTLGSIAQSDTKTLIAIWPSTPIIDYYTYTIPTLQYITVIDTYKIYDARSFCNNIQEENFPINSWVIYPFGIPKQMKEVFESLAIESIQHESFPAYKVNILSPKVESSCSLINQRQ